MATATANEMAEHVSEAHFMAPRHWDPDQSKDEGFQELLCAELAQLQQAELRKRAELQGIAAELIDAAEEKADPLEAMVKLMVEGVLPQLDELLPEVRAEIRAEMVGTPVGGVAEEDGDTPRKASLWQMLLQASERKQRESQAAQKAADERRARLEAFAAAAVDEEAMATGLVAASSPAGEQPDEPEAHWLKERGSLRSLHGDIDLSVSSLAATVASLQARLALASVEQEETRRTFAETKQQQARMTEARSIATDELTASMAAILQWPEDTGAAGKLQRRRWQVPVALVELVRLDSALRAAELNGVEARLQLDGKTLMRTKRAETRLAMLYVACERSDDPAAWIHCRHELELDTDLGGLMAHLYRAYDEAVAEGADAQLLNDARAMKHQLAAAEAAAARAAEEERLRRERLAKQAEAEEQTLHLHTLQRIARWELDSSHAFRKSKSKSDASPTAGPAAVTKARAFYASPPAEQAPPKTAEAQPQQASSSSSSSSGGHDAMLWSPGYRDDELAARTPAAAAANAGRMMRNNHASGSGASGDGAAAAAAAAAISFTPMVVR